MQASERSVYEKTEFLAFQLILAVYTSSSKLKKKTPTGLSFLLAKSAQTLKSPVQQTMDRHSCIEFTCPVCLSCFKFRMLLDLLVVSLTKDVFRGTAQIARSAGDHLCWPLSKWKLLFHFRRLRAFQKRGKWSFEATRAKTQSHFMRVSLWVGARLKWETLRFIQPSGLFEQRNEGSSQRETCAFLA